MKEKQTIYATVDQLLWVLEQVDKHLENEYVRIDWTRGQLLGKIEAFEPTTGRSLGVAPLTDNDAENL